MHVDFRRWWVESGTQKSDVVKKEEGLSLAEGVVIWWRNLNMSITAQLSCFSCHSTNIQWASTNGKQVRQKDCPHGAYRLSEIQIHKGLAFSEFNVLRGEGDLRHGVTSNPGRWMERTCERRVTSRSHLGWGRVRQSTWWWKNLEEGELMPTIHQGVQGKMWPDSRVS